MPDAFPKRRTIREAAEIADLSYMAVYRAVKDNEIAYIKIGNRHYLTDEAVQEFLAKRTVPANG
ncbi:helix-turn-helix domain-containing protein [Shinella granuli]|nr:helix-turn-helix domain-containing protein [Shinella granuli]